MSPGGKYIAPISHNMSGKHAIDDSHTDHVPNKRIKREDDKNPDNIEAMELVRHAFFQRAETFTTMSKHASPNTRRDLLPAAGGIGQDIFVKMVVCEKDHTAHWTRVCHSTAPVPTVRAGCQRSSVWIDDKGKNRVDIRFWGDPNKSWLTTKVDVSMWTDAPTMVFLRTLIKTDGSQKPTSDGSGDCFQHYFTPSRQEIQQNNHKTTFMFHLDITMQSSKLA